MQPVAPHAKHNDERISEREYRERCRYQIREHVQPKAEHGQINDARTREIHKQHGD